MAEERADSSRSSLAQELAARTLRPFTSAGIALERRTLDRVLESDEIEHVLMTALESPRFQVAVRRALASEGGRQLVDSLFDSGWIDHLLDRLGTSEALGQLVDDIADSEAVAAAIAQQGLGFADRVGDGLRVRARRADDWLEHAAERVVRRQRR